MAHMAKMTHGKNHGEIWNGKVRMLGVPALLTVFLVCADVFVMCAERVCFFLFKTWIHVLNDPVGQSRHTYEKAMAYILWLPHLLSIYAYECVVAHVWTNHVPHE